MILQIVKAFGIESLHRPIEHLEARGEKDHAEIGACLDKHKNRIGEQKHLHIPSDHMFLKINRYDGMTRRTEEYGAAVHPDGVFQKGGQIRILGRKRLFVGQQQLDHIPVFEINHAIKIDKIRQRPVCVHVLKNFTHFLKPNIRLFCRIFAVD